MSQSGHMSLDTPPRSVGQAPNEVYVLPSLHAPEARDDAGRRVYNAALRKAYDMLPYSFFQSNGRRQAYLDGFLVRQGLQPQAYRALPEREQHLLVAQAGRSYAMDHLYVPLQDGTEEKRLVHQAINTAFDRFFDVHLAPLGSEDGDASYTLPPVILPDMRDDQDRAIFNAAYDSARAMLRYPYFQRTPRRLEYLDAFLRRQGLQPREYRSLDSKEQHFYVAQAGRAYAMDKIYNELPDAPPRRLVHSAINTAFNDFVRDELQGGRPW